MAPSCKRQIMRRNQRRQLVLAVQSRHQLKNHLPGAAIEIAGRLVRQQNLRLRDQCPSQRQPLLFAAGKLSRTMLPALGQTHLAEPPRSFLLGGRERLPARQQRHGDILKSGEFRQQVVELPHIADFAVTKLGRGILGKRIHVKVCAVYGTRRRTIKRGQDVQQRTLSRTRLANDRQHRSLGDLKRQILKEHELIFA